MSSDRQRFRVGSHTLELRTPEDFTREAWKTMTREARRGTQLVLQHDRAPLSADEARELNEIWIRQCAAVLVGPADVIARLSTPQRWRVVHAFNEMLLAHPQFRRSQHVH